MASTLGSTMHEVAIQREIRAKVLRHHLVVEVASVREHATISINLHECAVNGYGHCMVAAPILHHGFGEAKELDLRACGNQKHAKGLSIHEASVAKLLEVSERVRARSGDVQLEELLL
eukprot:CAMPEP_0117511146 /NCGR_PEP_ID=MMETSP0784-20121206/28356_1 /TAXON_ID=39447 /ORGANISM="" /LENGTH=117 /DNA_ID=CAMNT_0005306807 /DNA_START=173 /DNA_END=526 /DNA_ORIENTATION=-